MGITIYGPIIGDFHNAMFKAFSIEEK